MSKKSILILSLAGLALLLAASCAPGNERWASLDNRANFWAGLWHGLIIIVTFVVSLFTNEVRIYEVNNVGWGYNLGFLLGCMISLGGGARASHGRKKRKAAAPDWDRLELKIETGVREGVRAAFESEKPSSDKEWDELGRRIEERIREKLRDWHRE